MAARGTEAPGRPRVAITRPDEGADELAELLGATGASAILTPLIRVAAPADGAPLRRALGRLSDYDWTVFTSANAVRAVAELRGGSSDRPARVAAVGPATAAAVRRVLGWETDLVPDEFTGTALADALSRHGPLAGARVLWPRAEQARPETARALRRAGVRLEDPVAYRTVEDAGVARRLAELVAAGAIDVVAFTSPSAVHCFARVHSGVLRCAVAVIGPTTARAAREQGIRVDIQPAEHTIRALADAIVSGWRR